MYRRTQVGTPILVPMAAAAVILVAVGAAVGWNALVLGAGVLFATLATLFHSLTVEVDHREVRCAFGIGLIRRTIPVERIVEARAVRNSWWYGWGIRLTPHGWMFNISGLDAVELEFVDGRRFRIGTADPNGLVRAIEQFRG